LRARKSAAALTDTHRHMQKSYLDTTTQGQRRFPEESSFVPITGGYRVLLTAYILLYSVFIPALMEILYGSIVPLGEWRFVADVAYQLLLFLPILYYRPDYGWLHPLLFIPLFGLARSLLQSPAQLLAPLFILDKSPAQEMAHIALPAWGQEALAWAALKAKLISMTALALYYVGFFFGPRLRIPRLAFPNPRSVVPKVVTVVVISTVVFLVYIRSEGGLTAHMGSWRQGRFIALEGDGPIFVMIKSGIVAILVWFSLDNTAYRNPLFWVVALFNVPAIFFASGSRSAVLYAVVLYLMIWLLRYRKLPQGRLMAMGVGALILLGVLGALRASTSKGEVAWTVLTDFDPMTSLQAGNEEVSRRSAEDGYLPVVAKVPDEVDFLYGRSYVGSLLFFVPRALWREKPRGAGAMNGELIFGRVTGGIPPGAVGEAYWNFSIPGVVAIFFLYGVFHQWLARTYTQYAHVPAFWVLYVITLFIFSPAGVSMVNYLHHIIPATALLCWIGALSFNKRKASRYVFA